MINEEIFQQTGWLKAATLAERIAEIQPRPQNSNRPIETPSARRKLEKWRSQPPFDTGDYLSRRLALDGIVEDQLLAFLSQAGCEADMAPDKAKPEWVQSLARAFSESSQPEPTSIFSLPYFQENAGFLRAVQPITDEAAERLRVGVYRLNPAGTQLPFDADAVPGIFFPNLGARLLAMLNRTMVLELNIARLEGRLEGNSSKERFESFLLLLRDRDFSLNLLREYPVLARQIMICADQWIAFSLEFLQSLCTDWAGIQDIFSPGGHPGALVEVNGTVGDRHRGGRSVLICRFDSGFQLVYKPRPLSLDVHFQELLEWTNRHTSDVSFRTLKILNRDHYGWVEFVKAEPCKSPEEIRRFYERQGAYLALLYAWEASDFHFENVIAAGEHPFLIDLEALCHPRIEVPPQQAADLAGGTLSYSVLRIGLLPRRIFGDPKDQASAGIDKSGLGGPGGQLSLGEVPWFEALGTDEMRIIRKRVRIEDRENRPSLSGVQIKVQDYGDAIVHGFTTIYETLLQHREELLSDDGPLARFSNDHVRAVLRSTEIYTVMLRESFHPDLLHDALDRDLFVDRLWVGVTGNPALEKLIAAERHDLLNGDIPIFFTRPFSCDLWTSTHQRLENFFSQSGLDLVKRRLRGLSEADLSRQIWFIRASLTSLTVGDEQIRIPNREQHRDNGSATPDRFIAEAIRVGERLKKLALEGRNEVSWVGIGLVNERFWSILPLGTQLYDGLPGIILFLAYLDAITARGDFTLLAKAALATLRRQIKELPVVTSIGGYSGLGGIIYVLCHLSILWGKDDLLDEADRIVDRLPALIRHDTNLDIISGSAGCLAALLVFYRCRPSERTLSVAVQCGDHLVKQARSMPQGIGWLVPAVASTPLTGFSHGAAGIAWALLELASLSGQEHFRRAALEGIAYERSLYLPSVGNWPDFRHELAAGLPPASRHCGVMWCHGATGIGLSRLGVMKHINDQDTQMEIEIALQTTLKEGFGFGHCLCHGDLGNLELFLQASLDLEESCWKQELRRLSVNILDSIGRDGWLCGTPSQVETPGLMTGLAGIGYELLRLAEPLRIPSVLSLAPPFLQSAAPQEIGRSMAYVQMAGGSN